MIELGLSDYRPERKAEERAITLSDFPGLASIIQPPNTAGVTVTEHTATRNAAFFNGVDLISSDVGKLPRHHYERRENDTRERLRGTPVDKVLSEPNEYTNAFDFWKTMQHLKLTWGNSYAEIEFDRALRPKALHIIPPSAIRPVMSGGQLRYEYRGAARVLEPWELIHLRGFSLDGISGVSVVALARLSLGLGLAAEQFGASFFGNGAWPGLVFTHPGNMSAPAQERFKASTGNEHGGPSKAHKVLVAEEGMKVEKIGIPPEDAQFLETREFQVVEVARWLNLPPHKLKHKMGERPGANLTEAELDYLSSCLDPHLLSAEQELDRKLIAPAMRGRQYVEHLREAHMRMLPEKEAENFKQYLDMGVISPEYIAAKKNLPPPPKKEQAPPPVAQDAPPQQDDERMRAALRALVVDGAARYARREAAKVRTLVKRGAEGLAKMEELYAEEEAVLRGYLAPAVRIVLASAVSPDDAEAVAARMAAEYVARSKEALLALPARNVEESAGALVTRWETARPLEVAEALLAQYRGKVGTIAPVSGRVESDEQTVRIVMRSPAPPTPAPIVIPAPLVTVNVPAPNVTVDAPVTVNVPKPNVLVEAPNVTVDAPVTVNIPEPKPVKVERDSSGKISGLRPAK